MKPSLHFLNVGQSVFLISIRILACFQKKFIMERKCTNGSFLLPLTRSFWQWPERRGRAFVSLSSCRGNIADPLGVRAELGTQKIGQPCPLSDSTDQLLLTASGASRASFLSWVYQNVTLSPILTVSPQFALNVSILGLQVNRSIACYMQNTFGLIKNGWDHLAEFLFI